MHSRRISRMSLRSRQARGFDSLLQLFELLQSEVCFLGPFSATGTGLSCLSTCHSTHSHQQNRNRLSTRFLSLHRCLSCPRDTTMWATRLRTSGTEVVSDDTAAMCLWKPVVWRFQGLSLILTTCSLAVVPSVILSHHKLFGCASVRDFLQSHLVVVYDSVVRFWLPPTSLLSTAHFVIDGSR